MSRKQTENGSSKARAGIADLEAQVAALQEQLQTMEVERDAARDCLADVRHDADLLLKASAGATVVLRKLASAISEKRDMMEGDVTLLGLDASDVAAKASDLVTAQLRLAVCRWGPATPWRTT